MSIASFLGGEERVDSLLFLSFFIFEIKTSLHVSVAVAGTCATLKN